MTAPRSLRAACPLAIGFAFACVGALIACNAPVPAPRAAPTATTAAGPSAALAAVVVRYDCTGIATPPRCARAASVVSPILAALARPTSRWSDAVAIAERLDARSLDDDEVAEAQLAMRYVAHLSANDLPLRRRAARALVRYLVSAVPSVAPKPSSPPEPEPALDHWIGPRALWIEKHADAPLLHDHESGFALAFRPVRSGEIRALVAQRTIVDAAYDVRTTAIVERIIVRRGTAVDAAACVIVRDVELRRCGGLRALDDASDLVPPSPFVPVAGDHTVMCRSCHAPGKRAELVDLEPAHAGAELAHRHAVFAENAAREGTLLRAWAAEPDDVVIEAFRR